MVCVKCQSKTAIIFASEDFTCECGKVHTLTHCGCADCGMLWREMDGQLFGDSEIPFEELADFMAPVDPEEEQRIFDNLVKEIEKMDRVQEGGSWGMADYVHRCLKCNSIAHEISPGTYKCGDEGCGFEWEVVNFD